MTITRKFSKQSSIPEPVESVFAWHGRPGAIERLSPPWAPVRLIRRTGALEPGAEVDLELSPFWPFSFRWLARHTECEENRMFRDVQVEGPFARWTHTHRFTPDGVNACVLEDEVEYALPLGTLSSPLFDGMIRNRLEKIFACRHSTTIADIDDHRSNGLNPMNILVTGSNGVIGQALIPFLTTGGHRVIRLIRRPPRPGTGCSYWDPMAGNIDLCEKDNIDAVIHLAGENISQGAWTADKKKRIIESRTRGTAILANALAKFDNPPKVFLSASAIGYYGNRGDRRMTEDYGPGDDFISEVCAAWEEAAAPAAAAGIRTVNMRIGVVLTPLGGALQRLLPVFRMGLGGRIGTGKQYVSWIGIDDVLGTVLHLLAHPEIEGPVNLVAPNPVTNADLAKALGKALTRPARIPVPATAIRTAFGQMGKETILSSTRVEPQRLVESGYRFRHPDLESALGHVLGT